MATQATDPAPICGRVDRRGRLSSADPPLERLQREAGSSLGAPVAIPQLAAVARLAQQLKIPVTRRVLAAAAQQDVDMWVRAAPEGDEVALTIERWTARPAPGPRLTAVAAAEPDPSAELRRWAVDDQLRLVSLSHAAAALFGVSVPDGSGQPLTRLIRLEEDEGGEMPMLKALASRSQFRGQPARRRRDDKPLVLDGEPMLSPSGGFAGFEGSVAALEGAGDSDAPQSDPGLNEVLRSPLRRIIDCADEIVDHSGGPLPSEYATYAGDISAAAHHLLSVVRSMGEDARAGRATLDLVELVNEAVRLMESGARERSISFAVEPLPAFAAIGDPRGVTQILVNLVGNAVRHSSPGAAVTISFERSDRHAIVHIADVGPGIDAADHERIFERFEQGSAAEQGSGLGLTIARRLARAMAGDVLLESMPGEGSRFSLVLPAA